MAGSGRLDQSGASMSTMISRLRSVPYSSQVSLEALADIGELEYLGRRIGRVPKGGRARVPLKLALSLMESGAARPDASALPTLSEINRLAWLETKSDELQRVDKEFYVRAYLLVRSLSSEGEEAERRLRFVKAVLMDIVRSRLQKIVRAAVSDPKPSKELLSNLALEEEALYLAVCEVVGSWLEHMRRVVEGVAYG